MFQKKISRTHIIVLASFAVVVAISLVLQVAKITKASPAVPNPGHPANQIEPGTFAAGDYAFPNNLTVGGKDVFPDEVYAGSQVLNSGWSGSINNGQWIYIGPTAYSGGILGSPRIANPNPSKYTLKHYLSASCYTGGSNYISVGINHTVLLTARTWSHSTFRATVKSGYFGDWTEFPSESAHSYRSNGLNLYVYGSGSNGSAGCWNITLHYVYVK